MVARIQFNETRRNDGCQNSRHSERKEREVKCLFILEDPLHLQKQTITVELVPFLVAAGAEITEIARRQASSRRLPKISVNEIVSDAR